MCAQIIDARVKQKTGVAADFAGYTLLEGEIALVRTSANGPVWNFKVGPGNFDSLDWSLQNPGAAQEADTSTVFPAGVPGLYIPTEDGTYEGVTVDLSVGYVQLIWDGSTLVKAEFPIDLAGYSTKKNVEEVIKKAIPGVVNNSIFNGSFANNREGWVSVLGGIVSAENNELKLIKAASLVAGGFDQKIDTPSQGDKLYVSINAKFIDTLPVSSFMYLRGGYSSENSENLVLSSTEGEYSFHSKIFTINEDPSGDVRLAIVNNYSSDTIGVELTSYFKYATLVNLTKVFGAGNEPSAEAVDKAIKKEPNKWIDDFVVISTDSIPYGVENLVTNGDMSVVGSDGLPLGFQKGSAVTSASVVGGRLHFTSPEISTAGAIYYDLPYGLTEGNLYYISAYVDNLSLLSGGNTVPNPTKGMKSFIFDRPEGFRRIQFRVRNLNQDASFGSLVFIDLTKTFGAGNEPSLLEMDRLLSRFPERWFEGTVSLTSDINSYTENYFENFKNKYSLKITSIPYKTNNPADEREIYPVLFGVKMSNQRNVNNGYKSHPIPVGWLYYIPEAPYKVLYASGTPDNPKEIFIWDESITPGGNLTPEFYSPMICKNGDIVFVFRTEKSSTLNRQNPILYKASDNYATPVVIDFAGKPVKPCAWLQNCGADFIYDENVFMFAEYVRSWSGSPNVWKVSYPLEDPDNWEIVMTDNTVEHFHTVQLDTYSNDIYVTSGDAESESNIWRTDNLGSSFELVRSGSALEARLLNMAFTEESAFWASDDGRHVINQVDRGPDGRLDFDTLRVIFDLRGLGRTVTYSTVLIDEPFGLLLLDNLDTAANDPNVIRFFDLKTRELHELTTLYQMEDGTVQEFGFRSEAVNFYQSPATNKIVIGFGFKPNNFEMIGNTRGDNIDRRANLAIEIY